MFFNIKTWVPFWLVFLCFESVGHYIYIFFFQKKISFVFSAMNELNRIVKDDLVKKGLKYWQMILKNIVIMTEQIKTVSI